MAAQGAILDGRTLGADLILDGLMDIGMHGGLVTRTERYGTMEMLVFEVPCYRDYYIG